jgi:phospholipase C
VLTRRSFVRSTLSAGAALAGVGGLEGAVNRALAASRPPRHQLSGIEHVVILIQENRSFDHYYGTLRGVRGFGDPQALRDPVTGRSVFDQIDPDLVSAIGCLTRPSYSFPSLPGTATLVAQANSECASLPASTIPADQQMPTQEPGSRARVGTACAKA